MCCFYVQRPLSLRPRTVKVRSEPRKRRQDNPATSSPPVSSFDGFPPFSMCNHQQVQLYLLLCLTLVHYSPCFETSHSFRLCIETPRKTRARLILCNNRKPLYSPLLPCYIPHVRSRRHPLEDNIALSVHYSLQLQLVQRAPHCICFVRTRSHPAIGGVPGNSCVLCSVQ